MKHFNKLNSAKAMAFVTIAGISTVLSLTSCQQDDEDFRNPQSMAEEKFEETASVNDSIFVNAHMFNYDNKGVTSGDQYVADIDFGLNSSGMQTRGGTMTRGGTIINNGALSYSDDLQFATHLMDLVSSKADANSANSIMNNIFKASDGSTTMSKLVEINGKINNVTNMIEELSQKAQDDAVAKCYDRIHKYSALRYESCNAIRTYMNCISTGDTELAKKTVNAWNDANINGTNAATATYNYLSAIPALRTNEGMCLTDIYDYWVFQTTPWEHKGYGKREQLRLADVVVCTSSYLLARTFYEQNYDNGGKEKIELLDAAFKKFKDFYSTRYNVPRHEDVKICQIKGAHIVFGKYPGRNDENLISSDICNHDWLPKGSTFKLVELMYGENNRPSDRVVESSLSEQEVMAIINYYKSRNEAIDKYNLDEKKMNSLREIFAEAGFKYIYQACEKHRNILILSDGCKYEAESFWNNNFILTYNRVALLENDLNETIKKDWRVGSIWLKPESRTVGRGRHKKTMTVKTVQQWDNYIDAVGISYLHTIIDHRYNGTNPEK